MKLFSYLNPLGKERHQEKFIYIVPCTEMFWVVFGLEVRIYRQYAEEITKLIAVD